MTERSKSQIDEIGWKILRELQENARIPFAELGRRVGLSTAAVAERVRRMEDEGIITGYRAEIDAARIGLPITAFVRLSVIGDLLGRVVNLARDMPEVLECHRVTGQDTFILKVAVASVEHLEGLLDRFTPYMATTTAIVLSSAVTRRIFEPVRQ